MPFLTRLGIRTEERTASRRHAARRIATATSAVASAAVLLSLLTVGCVPKKDRSGLLKGVPTQQVRLEMEHTSAPDLEITLPQGFIASWAQEARYEKFYIYDPADSGVTQRGLLIIDISPAPVLSIPDSTKKVEKSRGAIGDADVTWRESVLNEPPVKVHQREMVQQDILSRYHSADGAGPLTLHAIVAGSDRDLVERLTAAVETIKVLPAKANL